MESGLVCYTTNITQNYPEHYNKYYLTYWKGRTIHHRINDISYWSRFGLSRVKSLSDHETKSKFQTSNWTKTSPDNIYKILHFRLLESFKFSGARYDRPAKTNLNIRFWNPISMYLYGFDKRIFPDHSRWSSVGERDGQTEVLAIGHLYLLTMWCHITSTELFSVLTKWVWLSIVHHILQTAIMIYI